MTSLGVWSCQWRELRPINFGGLKAAVHASPAPGTSNADDGVFGGDEEMGGYGRGRGRGRGRDGNGEYEMVGMKGEGEMPG